MSPLTHWLARAHAFANMLLYHHYHHNHTSSKADRHRSRGIPPERLSLHKLPVIILDNTHLTRDFLLPYTFLAAATGFMVISMESSTPWSNDIDACFHTNSHNILHERLVEMSSRYEPIECASDLFF